MKLIHLFGLIRTYYCAMLFTFQQVGSRQSGELVSCPMKISIIQAYKKHCALLIPLPFCCSDSDF